MEIKKLIEQFEANFREYYQLLTQLAEGNISYLPGESTWDIRQLLEVLADLEDEIIDLRLKKILEEEHPYLPRIEMERIKADRLYRDLTTAQLVEHVLHQRRELLKLLYSLPREQWQRTGVHEVEGHITFQELVRRMVEKDRLVLDQIRRFVHKSVNPAT